MWNASRMILRLGLVVFLLIAGVQSMASAQGRGRGAGRSAGGPPAGTGVDRAHCRSEIFAFAVGLSA